LDREWSTLSKWALEPPSEANARTKGKDKVPPRPQERISRSHGPTRSLEHASQRQANTLLRIVVIHK